MLRILLKNSFRFIAMILIQVLLLDNVLLGGYLNPYFYILFILLLPFEIPRWILLVSGFLIGISIDLFSNTLGMHTAASVFIAFIRPRIMSILAPRDGYEQDTTPSVHHYGLNWFAAYAGILTFMHHMVLFYIEAFTFQDFFSTFLRVIFSTLLTASTLLISQYFIFRK